MRVMMSAAGTAVAPGIVRHLQRLGHHVIGHDSCALGAGTAIADEFQQSPSVSDSWQYMRFLAQRTHDLYLPFLDEELRVFSNISYGMPQHTLCSPGDTLRTFTSKIVQQNVLQFYSLPVPRATIDGDVIAKPDLGRGGAGIIRTRDWKLAGHLRAGGRHLVQEFIAGDEYTVDVLTDLDGGYLFAVPRLRIQAKGVSIIGQVQMDPEVIKLAQRIVSAFKFAGPINIQMIRESGTGKLYIIEINARLSGSCMFTVMAGFDILDASIKLWQRQPFVAPEKVEEIIVRRYYVEEKL